MENIRYRILIPGLCETSLNLGVNEKWPINDKKQLTFMFKHLFSKNINYDTLFDDIFNPNIQTGHYIKKNENFITKYLAEHKTDYSIFSYNWLRGVKELSDEFIAFIENIDTDKDFEIIGYSYGGLIGYHALSKRNKNKNSNLNRVKSFISVGTPYKGSIKATSLILGQNGYDNNYEIIKKYIHNERFQSIYDLFISYYDKVFIDENGRLLTTEEIQEFLLEVPFINKEKLTKSLILREEIKAISILDIDFKCFIGNDVHSYIPQFFKINREQNTIVTRYGKASSDGVVSLYEALPEYKNIDTASHYSIHYLLGHHSSILHSDEFYNELKKFNEQKTYKDGIIFADVDEIKKDNVLKITLKLDVENNIYNILKLTAKNVFLTHNSNKMNLYNKIISKNNETYFFVNPEFNFGTISLSKANITYTNELNEKKILYIQRSQIKY